MILYKKDVIDKLSEKTGLYKKDNQLCIYAVEFLKLFFVSIPIMFIRLALPISATSSSLLYSSEPKATSLFFLSSALLHLLSFIVLCTDS